MQLRNITRNWAIASAVAAMLAASTPGTFAQTPDATAPPAAPGTMTPDTTNTPPTSTPPGPTSTTPDNSNTTPSTATTTPGATTTPDSTAPMSTTPMTPPMASPAPMSGMSGSEPTDYKILSNRYFTYPDLQKARARGLSENEIASIVKITKETGLPFEQVSAAVERGETFPALASEYGMRLGDVYSVDKEKQEVSDYTTLYQEALDLGKNNSMATPMSSMPMTPAPMSSTPMTPDTTTPAASSTALDIVDTAMAAKNLTTLVKALQVAGLVETLKGAGPFTVFAPDDKAFSKLPAGALDALLADPAKLKTVLTYHVIPASIRASDALAMTTPTSPPTVEGGTLQVTKGRRGRLKVNDATVTKADIEASNGVIHIIDTVLMPPTDTTTPAASAPLDNTTPAAPTLPAPATPDTTTPPATPDTTTPPAAPDATAPPAVPATPDTTTPPAAPDTTTPPPAPAAPDTTTPGATTPPAQ